MRRFFVLTAVLTTLMISAGFAYRGANQISPNQKCACQFIEESIRDIGKIRIGMTRGELLESFGEEGGISTRTQRRYVYNKCVFIKVEAKFSPVGDEANKSVELPGDKIVEISKPFLEFSIND